MKYVPHDIMDQLSGRFEAYNRAYEFEPIDRWEGTADPAWRAMCAAEESLRRLTPRCDFSLHGCYRNDLIVCPTCKRTVKVPETRMVGQGVRRKRICNDCFYGE